MKYSRLVIRYLLVLATLGLTGLVNAEQQIYNINLPAQTVAQSLNALSRLSFWPQRIEPPASPRRRIKFRQCAAAAMRPPGCLQARVKSAVPEPTALQRP